MIFLQGIKGTSLSLLLAVCCSLAILSPAAVMAKPPEKPAQKTYPFYGKLLRITSSALELESSSKKAPRRISLTPETRFTRDGRPATAAGARLGQWIGGSARKDAVWGERAVTVNLSVKQKDR